MDEDESILKEFLVECAEGVGRLDQEFVALEADPDNTEILASIFRTIHTIKGTCGFLGLPKLENVAHGGENVLSKMRDRKLAVTPACAAYSMPASVARPAASRRGLSASRCETALQRMRSASHSSTRSRRHIRPVCGRRAAMAAWSSSISQSVTYS